MQILWSSGRILPVLLCLIMSVCSGTVSQCPEYCKCDKFQQLKRAVCQDRQLISIDLNIPKAAQILDVSHNRISELGDKIFLNLELTNLKLLNLSFNILRQIHFNAFEGMDKLKTLDLSYNAIEYFTKSWFEDWQSLEELYLRRNHLRTINDQPQIAVASLKVLDLADCAITSLNPGIFQMVPNLEVLDISHNYIQTIQVQLLQTVPNLVEFRADGNSFKCNSKKLHAVQNYTKIHKILYTSVCTENIVSTNKKMRKFEKIVMESSNDLESTTTISNRKNSWIFDENSEEDKTPVIKCPNQTEASSEDDDDDDDDKSLLMNIIQLSPWLVTTLIFVYGVLFGMVISCCVKICWNPRLPRRKPKETTASSSNENQPTTQRQRRSNSALYKHLNTARRSAFQHSEVDDDDSWSWDDTLMMNEFDLANSTPMVTRKVVP